MEPHRLLLRFCTVRVDSFCVFAGMGGWVGTHAAFSLLLIPNAPDIGALLGDEHSEGKNPGAIVFAVLGFAILDCANNMLQGPCRALLIDVAPQHQQEQGNSFFSIALAIGNCTGYLAGTVNWGELMPWSVTVASPLRRTNFS